MEGLSWLQKHEQTALTLLGEERKKDCRHGEGAGLQPREVYRTAWCVPFCTPFRVQLLCPWLHSGITKGLAGNGRKKVGGQSGLVRGEAGQSTT